MFYKVRELINGNILKLIYYALFESHIKYVCIIWGQTISTTISTFSRKKHSELSILESVILTPILYFITLKLSRLQKSQD